MNATFTTWLTSIDNPVHAVGHPIANVYDRAAERLRGSEMATIILRDLGNDLSSLAITSTGFLAGHLARLHELLIRRLSDEALSRERAKGLPETDKIAEAMRTRLHRTFSFQAMTNLRTEFKVQNYDALIAVTDELLWLEVQSVS